MKKEILILLTAILVGCVEKEPPEVNLIPKPLEQTVGSGTFTLTANTPVYYAEAETETPAKYLQTVLLQTTGSEHSVSQGTGESKSISISLDNTINTGDAYKLEVTRKGIKLTGTNPRGVMLGIQTLRQLIPVKTAAASIEIPCIIINDKPHWEWRGMMLDVARHFYTKEEVKSFLDLMAMYKFNKFHWHLTDDQGWRIEIKKYPLLTEVGGWREFNSQDRECLRLAEAQSNPDYLLPENKLRNNGTEYGGYYTQEDIKEVVAYASMLGIDVMPEIDMPGHFSAAITPYPFLSCFNKPGWGETFSAPICPGKDTTLEFCKNVYAEVFELFPFEYVDLGADEVEKHNWKICPNCQARIKKNNLKDEKELQSWFVHQMEDFFTENGKKMVGWDEILEGGMSETATMMWWRTWAPKAVHEATAQGNEVILTPNSHFYFDYQQDHSTLRNLYDFQPVPDGLNNNQTQLIKGIQANLWAEWIPSYQRAQYMVMPRMLALSELAWTPDADRSWEDFYPRLLVHFNRMDDMKINYRPLDLTGVHVSNSFVGETTVVWDYPLPNVTIRYTTDGTVPDQNSAIYNEPFTLDKSTDFTIRFFRPDGTAADIVKTSYRKEEYIAGEEIGDKQPGLRSEWREAVVNRTDKIDALPVTKEYIVDGIIIPDGINNKRAMKYYGYLNIEKDDIYTFSLGSDDGSKLYINDETVVDNDGPHGPVVLRGQKALGKGLHPFLLYYFDMDNGGFLDLKIFNSNGDEVKQSFYSKLNNGEFGKSKIYAKDGSEILWAVED